MNREPLRPLARLAAVFVLVLVGLALLSVAVAPGAEFGGGDTAMVD